MLQSMTGYAKSKQEYSGGSVVVEIKSLNSKFLDLSLKYPSQFRDKENELRSVFKNSLIRGKIDCYITIESEEELLSNELNKKAIVAYYNELVDINHELGITQQPDPSVFIQLPEVLQKREQLPDENQWSAIYQAIETACKELIIYRTKEGESLESDFSKCISSIQNHTEEITEFDKSRIDKIRNRILQHLKNFLDENSIDKNRYEQEAIYYIEKIDITEELSRLNSHLFFFREVLESDYFEKGKKLNFIAQEIGREINTLGAKLNDAQLQRLVVEMKDELEKIKEQTLNTL